MCNMLEYVLECSGVSDNSREIYLQNILFKLMWILLSVLCLLLFLFFSRKRNQNKTEDFSILP